MDINTISTLVGSLGFPIVACCYMFYLHKNTIEQQSIVLAEIKDALDALKEAFDRKEIK